MFRLTVPMVFGIVSLMLLGVVDSYFVGKLGTVELAAISFALPVCQIVISVALGIGMAISSLTSRLIGERRHSDAARMITDGLLLAVAAAVVISAIGITLISPLFKLLGAGPEVMPYIKSFMIMWFAGAPFLMLTVNCSATLRAIGDIKSSAVLIALLSLLNITLDPLLIFGVGPFPEMGVEGAALATVISSFVTLVCSVIVIGYRERLIILSWPGKEQLSANWRELLKIGVPAIGANIMTPFAAAVVTAIIAVQGAEAVAGFGVGSRIESLTLIVIFALSSTLPMFIGQNIGAGKGSRAYHALMGSLRFGLYFQAAVYLVLIVFSSAIANTFSQDPAVTYVIRMFLLVLPLTYGAHAVVILVMVSLNVLKRPRTALLITVIRLVLLYLPLAYIGSLLAGTLGLFIGAACGNIIAGIAAFRIVKTVCIQQGVTADPGPNAVVEESASV